MPKFKKLLFQIWSKLKPQIDKKIQEIFFYEREIWYTHLGKNIGFEQDGKGEEFKRPIIIIKKFNQFCFIAVPLTTKTKKGKYYFQIPDIKNKKNYVILSQIKFFSSNRLISKIGTLDKENFKTLKKKIIEVCFND